MSQLDVFRGQKIIITGHTGFKGSWLSLWLNSLGAEVWGISLDPLSNPSHFEAAQISLITHDKRQDITLQGPLVELVGEIQPNFLFHLAAQALVRESYSNPVDTWKVNLMGTVNVLEALRFLDNKCVAVFITSDKCYDNVEWVWGYRETDKLGGPDPYSGSKGAAELAISSYVRSYFPPGENIRLGIGRAGNVIGGGDWSTDRIIPDCVRAWSNGETVELRNPMATRPWQHVLEPLSGYLDLALNLNAKDDLHGQAFNFGPSTTLNYSVGDLVDSMSLYWEKVRWADVSAQYGGPYESSLLKLNCDKALNYLGWHAVWEFEETVKRTAEWYRAFYENPTQSIADISLEQIKAYTNTAKSRGLLWAQ